MLELILCSAGPKLDSCGHHTVIMLEVLFITCLKAIANATMPSKLVSSKECVVAAALAIC